MLTETVYTTNTHAQTHKHTQVTMFKIAESQIDEKEFITDVWLHALSA